MSLIRDISKWSRKTVISSFIFSVSVLVLAIVLFLILPSAFGSKIQYRVNPAGRSDLLENTKLKLIFRTHAHLAGVLKIPQNDIILESVTNKIWTDNSLECPIPLYGPSVVPIDNIIPYNIHGWTIAYKIGTTSYLYHTSIKGEWVLCSKIEIPNNIAIYHSPSNN